MLNRLARCHMGVFLAILSSAAFAGTPALGAAVQSPRPSVAPSVNSRVAGRAREWFHRFQAAEIDRSELSSLVNAQLTDQLVQQEAAKLKPLGNPISFKFLKSYPINGKMGYDFLLQFKDARVVEMIAFDSTDKIAGIDFQIFLKTEQ
jgi:hypothetical protein